MMSDIESELMGSSGCESGWTLYLDDHSHFSNFNTADAAHLPVGGSAGVKMEPLDDEGGDELEQEYIEDEYSDASMMSDASSGPPQYTTHHHHYDQHQRPAELIHDYNDDEQQQQRCFYKNSTTHEEADNYYYCGSTYDYKHESRHYCCDSPSAAKGVATALSSSKSSTTLSGRKTSSKPKCRKGMITSSHLDDTASSSPMFNFQNNIGLTRQGSIESLLDYSQGYSTTHRHNLCQVGKEYDRRRWIQ